MLLGIRSKSFLFGIFLLHPILAMLSWEVIILPLIFALKASDWGSVDLSIVDAENEESQQKLEDDFDAFTTTKASDLSQPLVEAQIPFKIHIVKDHDMKERLCLEVERLGLSAVIMGSRGFGATRKRSNN